MRTHMVYALTGEIDDAAVACAMALFEARLERARAALRCRAAGVRFEEMEGAHRLADTAVLLDLDADYFAEWRTHSALEWTMEEDMRPGSTAHLRTIAEESPRARCLANLAPAHAIALPAPTAPAPQQLSMRNALELRELRCAPRPSRSEEAAAPVLVGKTRAAAQREAQEAALARPAKRVTRVTVSS